MKSRAHEAFAVAARAGNEVITVYPVADKSVYIFCFVDINAVVALPEILEYRITDRYYLLHTMILQHYSFFLHRIIRRK